MGDVLIEQNYDSILQFTDLLVFAKSYSRLNRLNQLFVGSISYHFAKGPSIKYVTLFLANFDPLPLSHFVTHPGPPKVRHTSRTPLFLGGLVQNPGQKPPVQILS